MKANLALAAFALLSLAPAPCRAQSRDGDTIVQVRLTNGRVLTGELDAGTDSRRIRLRHLSAGILLTTTVERRLVERVVANGRELDSQEIAAIADIPSPEPEPAPEIADAPTPEEFPSNAPALRPRPVRSLQVEAVVANWDRDIAADGLELHILPLAADGTLVAAAGTLRVRLLGQQLPPLQITGFELQRPRFPQLGQWGRVLRGSDYGDEGAVLRLPFQRANPQFDLNLSAAGQVVVDFAATGQGTFQASVPAWLRGSSWLQQQWQLLEGRPFFPIERPR